MPDNSHARPQYSKLYSIPVVMVFVASTAFYLSSMKASPNITGVLVNFFLEITFVLTGTLILKRSNGEHSEQHMSLILVSVMLLSFLWEPVCRYFFSSGRTFELIMMFSLKNTLLAMAIACHIRKYQYLMAWGSLFLLIFSVTFQSSPPVLLLLAIYLVLGLFWMAGNYWNTFRNLLMLSSKESHLKKFYLIPVILLGLLALSYANSSSHIRVLNGYLPSSGGEGMSDEYANNGTGDGELLVAGKYDIRTFAALDNAPFLSSDEPSLYDIFSDTYQEEFNPNKSVDRAISLIAKDTPLEEAELPESENINQNFSTSRNSEKEGDKTADSIKSDAVLYVSGRTPLHLRMECYDLFDGVDWTSESVDHLKNQLSLQVKMLNGEPWISVSNLENIVTSNVEDELHVINNLKLKSNILPSPLHYNKFHVDKLEQANMFGWHQNSIPKMNRDSLPRMVPIHMVSRFPDSKNIQARKTFYNKTKKNNRYLVLPDSPVIQELKKTAHLMTQDARSYSEKIRIIEKYHREKYQPDRSVSYVNDKESPLEQFIEKEKSGPDYLICTSAAAMLRSLGFETRLVSGFYARPEKYDYESKHTPVHKEDAHFWLEVKVAPGYSSWMTVEPSRGYEVLGPEPGILDKIQYALLVMVHSIYQNIFQVLGIIFLLIIGFRNRYLLLDRLVTRWNQFFEPVDIRQLIINTQWITELRLKKLGYSRPATETFTSWVYDFNHLSVENQSMLTKLGTYLNWAVYSPESQNCKDITKLKEIRLVCREILVNNKLANNRDSNISL